MKAIRPIHQKTASEMTAVLDRLTDFARRITEVGKDTELTSATVIHIVSGKLHPDLYYEFERWMRHDFPTEELSVTRIIEFLRAETEARETISPGAIKSELRRPSVHHVTGATYRSSIVRRSGSNNHGNAAKVSIQQDAVTTVSATTGKNRGHYTKCVLTRSVE